MPGFLGNIDLTVIYWVFLGIGLVVLFLAFILDDLFHMGHDGSVMPIAAFFMGVFGASGVITLHLFNMTSGGSLLASFFCGTAGSLILYFGFYRMIKKFSGSLKDQREDIVGSTAEVSLAISAEQLGQITYTTPSGRSSAPARSADGAPIKQGTLVKIVQSVGTTYIVKPLGAAESGNETKEEKKP
jgi:membrane protein implicated in regulation of membrane protease activity